MEFYDVINQRASCRSYDPDRPVPDETLRRILNVGRMAPSAANRQPWIFCLASSEQALARLRPCYHREWYRDAPHILAVVGRPDESWVRAEDGYNSIETDLTIAMDHLILAAENEGVGACWVAAFDYPLLKEALELSESEVVFAITPLGYPRVGVESKREKKRKPLEEVVRYL